MGYERIEWDQLCRNGELLHIARIEKPQTRSWNLHCHDFFECFWIEGGAGVHAFDRGSSSLIAQQLWFVRPEHVHGFRVKSGSHPPKFVNVAFPYALVEGFLDRHSAELPDVFWRTKADCPECLMLSPGQFSALRKLFANLSTEGRRAVDAEWFLCGLARLLQSHASDFESTDMPLWLRESLFQMRQPRHFKHGVPRLVELCNRTPAHVSRSMRLLTGMTPVQWVQRLRMHYAATLLQTTELSVTEIALEVGMENLSHFHRTFRDTYGSSPLRYRRTHSSGVVN